MGGGGGGVCKKPSPFRTPKKPACDWVKEKLIHTEFDIASLLHFSVVLIDTYISLIYIKCNKNNGKANVHDIEDKNTIYHPIL